MNDAPCNTDPQSPPPAEKNPFSTRFIRPGAIAYRFPEGTSAELLIEQFVRNGWRGEIVGPHGSGKSTLLESLQPALTRRAALTRIGLRQADRCLPRGWNEAALETAERERRKSVVVIDGFEQLGRFQAWRTLRTCDRHGLGLLITTHRRGRLPLLFETRVEEATALELARHLLASHRPSRTPVAALTDEEILAEFHRLRGDLRETFFALYDLYEQRRRC